MTTLKLGDRVKVSGYPDAPVLTVHTLYIQTSEGGEELRAVCTWGNAGRVDFKASELVAE